MLKERLNRALTSVLATIAHDDQSTVAGINSIVDSYEPRFGDFSSSAALKLAGSDSSKALPIAQDLASKILALKEADELIEELSVVAPGYLNFLLNNSCLAQVFCQIHREKQCNGGGTPEQQEQVLSIDRLQVAAIVGFDPEMIGFTSRRDPIAFMGYVYERCASFLRLTLEEYPNISEGRIDPPRFDIAEWQKLEKLFATESNIFDPVFVYKGVTLAPPRTLALKLDAMPVEIEHFDKSQDWLRLVRFSYEVATALERFRQTVRFQTEDRDRLAASLGVLDAGRQVLGSLLKRTGTGITEIA